MLVSMLGPVVDQSFIGIFKHSFKYFNFDVLLNLVVDGQQGALSTQNTAYAIFIRDSRLRESEDTKKKKKCLSLNLELSHLQTSIIYDAFKNIN